MCSGCEWAPQGDQWPFHICPGNLTHLRGGLSFSEGLNLILSKDASGPVKFAVD